MDFEVLRDQFKVLIGEIINEFIQEGMLYYDSDENCIMFDTDRLEEIKY